MTKTYTNERDALINTITKAAGKLSSLETHFIQSFFAQAPLADIQFFEPQIAAKTAQAAYRFAQKRKGTEPLISITSAQASSGITISILGDDMPFLVDSISMLLHKLGIKNELTLHPILAVARDSKGVLTSVSAADESHTLAHESLIVICTSRLPQNLSNEDLTARIRSALHKVRASVSDWKRMSKAALAAAEPFETRLPGIPSAEAWEIGDFLRWLADKNFVFLGLGEFDFTSQKNTSQLRLNSKTALGLYTLPVQDSVADNTAPIEHRSTPTTARFIEITKSSEPSEVHRAVPMDMIAVKRYGKLGNIVGETRILGLFTSNVYYQTTDAIPIIRRKVARVIERSGFDLLSHNGKSMKAILEFLPRDELFQLSEDALFTLSMGILALESRPKVRLFTRIDAFERYASCIVYVPRERFTTTVREQIERILARAYNGNVITFYTQVSDSPLARINILIATTPKHIPTPAIEALEHEITDLTNLWADALRTAAITQFGKTEGEAVAGNYANAFDSAYITAHTGISAISDIKRIKEAVAGDGLALELFERVGEASTDIHLKCYTTDTASTLSDVVPMLENMGTKLVEVHPYLVRPLDGPAIVIRDFVLRLPAGHTLDLSTHKARLESAISNIWRDIFADDALNGLLFKTTLTARDIDILRVFCRYLRQINFAFGQMVIWRTLNSNASIAEKLVQYFNARFDPAQKSRESAMEKIKTSILQDLESVSNLTDDRIIRRLQSLMECAVRTNAFQPSAISKNNKPYISIKFLSRNIPELPLPKPYAEIFVYSMATEGIHLRGDTVARGGLRWSDRPEDFRTEVLGLMKAQMVKNAVIVPSGSKGGFILKHNPTDRAALQEVAVSCYKQFLSGLLDITDNIVNGKIVAPAHTVRHDGDDPYLVVAADKGTATFSDIANSVSAQYGFWLGDAFASGGSAGYDHKDMAITARGAWISVERHFREMGHDIAQKSFTCVGIGDMSGDVFGNGMLLSSNMQLIAAFNHRHIFLDPTPNSKTSFAERKRLFALPRSGWSDYNTKLISKGGGVFERSVKSITLSKEVQTALATDVKSASPDELIQLILKAPVHLLWNGGIGTYIKSTEESHDEVGDRANNALRVNGAELRCNIIGEGGNLGCTQLGRIEYARTGGRINTDAIDNSAGVDCSDHEVNIKIALGRAVSAKRLTLAKRNTLLKTMEEEVAHLVLEDNRLQTQALTLAEARSASLLEPLAQLMQDLEKQNFLSREVEFLPTDKDIAELKASNLGLTRPELAVLLAYSKLACARDLKGSTRLDDAYFTRDLTRYFPRAMHKPYAADIAAHPLKREIIATVLINEIINRLGIVSVHQAMHDTGEDTQTIIDAYVFVRDVFGIDTLFGSIESLDGIITPALQLELFSTVRDFVSTQIRWVARHLPKPLPFAAFTKHYIPAIASLQKHWKAMLAPSNIEQIRSKADSYSSAHVPAGLSEHIALLPALSSAGIIIEASRGSTHSPAKIAAMFYAVEHALSIGQISRSIAALPASTPWQRQAASTASATVSELQQRILTTILKRHSKSEDPATAWLRASDTAFKRYQRFLASLGMIETLDAAMLFVALHELELLASE